MKIYILPPMNADELRKKRNELENKSLSFMEKKHPSPSGGEAGFRGACLRAVERQTRCSGLRRAGCGGGGFNGILLLVLSAFIGVYRRLDRFWITIGRRQGETS